MENSIDSYSEHSSFPGHYVPLNQLLEIGPGPLLDVPNIIYRAIMKIFEVRGVVGFITGGRITCMWLLNPGHWTMLRFLFQAIPGGRSASMDNTYVGPPTHNPPSQ